MKKILSLAAAIFLVTATLTNAQIAQNVGTLGVGVDGGILIPASGDVTADDGFGDYFGIGPAFGLHVQYNVIKEITVRTGFSYDFMKMDEDMVSGDDEPYFTDPNIYLDGVFNLGNFINEGNGIINPYATAGCGLYFWKVTDDGAGGDAMAIGDEEWKKTSFGLRFGAGVEVFAMPQLSFFAEGKYNIIFTKDEDKFGDDFSNMGPIDVKAGLTYYFPLGAK